MPSGHDDTNSNSKLGKDRPSEDGIDDFEEFPSEINVHDTKALLEKDRNVVLVDCRQPKEHSFSHIAGSILIPMDELGDRLDELKAYRDQRIIVYCHHGGRSLQVVNWLRNHGFAMAQNMTGGIDVWSQEIDSELPRY